MKENKDKQYRYNATEMLVWNDKTGFPTV